MDDRYIRNIGALSEEEQSILKGSTVFVAGCGGLGGHNIDMLLRLGVGNIRCADGDRFDVSNLNRQLLSCESNIGVMKASVAAAHAADVNSSVSFISDCCFIDGSNAAELISGSDAVIDALDNIASRRILKHACDELGIPYIYGAIRGWYAQAAVSLPGDGLIDLMYPGDGPVPDKSTLAFTPALCAAVQTALCVKLLCGRALPEKKLYFFDLNDFDFEAVF